MHQDTPLAEELTAYRHGTPITVRYGDIDMLRHVNNAKYLTYLEQARIKYLFEVVKWDGTGQLNLILARAELDFKVPVFLPDRLVVYGRVSRLGNKSFDMDYLLVKHGLQTQPLEEAQQVTPVLAARAKAVLVGWNPVQEVSERIPDDMRAKIIAFEPGLAQRFSER